MYPPPPKFSQSENFGGGGVGGGGVFQRGSEGKSLRVESERSAPYQLFLQ